MPTEPFLAPVVLIASTFGVCLASGFIPLVNAELYLIGLSAALPPGMAVPVILSSALGQMAAKSVMFLGGKGAVRIPARWSQAALAGAKERLERRPAFADTLIFLSAFSGFPPFYLISVAAGAVGHGFRRFFLTGFAGRLLRFAAAVSFPQLVKDLFG